MTWRTAQSGFSLVELMVAIVILGIGMTMVATVFPVAIQMSGETSQMSIANAAADAALATVQLRAPAAKDLGSPPGVAAPPHGISLGPELADFTELSGWDGDVWVQDLSDVINIPKAQVAANWAFALRMQNLPANWSDTAITFPNGVKDLDEKPPVPDFTPVGLPNVTDPNRLPQISMFDRVYPPVAVEVKYNRTLAGWDTTDPNLVDPTDPGDIPSILDHVQSGELASRRYAWHVLHRRPGIPIGDLPRTLILTIVVTHRADLGARFAQQFIRTPPLTPVNIPPDTAGTNPVEPTALVINEPSPDTLFPQMWLVRLTEIDPSKGIVTCTKAVAELLPTGSTFIIAHTPSAAAEAAGFAAGMPHKVIKRHDLPATASFSDPTALEIARGSLGSELDVAVWVFPPPIERTGADYRFGAQCPIVGVFLREVILP